MQNTKELVSSFHDLPPDLVSEEINTNNEGGYHRKYKHKEKLTKKKAKGDQDRRSTKYD